MTNEQTVILIEGYHGAIVNAIVRFDELGPKECIKELGFVVSGLERDITLLRGEVRDYSITFAER